MAEIEHGYDPLHHGHELVERYIWFAFLVGIGLGFLVYVKGYTVAAALTDHTTDDRLNPA